MKAKTLNEVHDKRFEQERQARLRADLAAGADPRAGSIELARRIGQPPRGGGRVTTAAAA